MYIKYNQSQEAKFDVNRFTSNVKRDGNNASTLFIAEINIDKLKTLYKDLGKDLESVLFNIIPKKITSIHIVNDEDEIVIEIEGDGTDSLFPEITRNISDGKDRLLFRFEKSINN